MWLALSLAACGRGALPATGICDDLSPGDLVITEVHANPNGGDGNLEYIELFNPSQLLRQLDGLVLQVGRADGSGLESHRFFDASVGAGGYFVLGNADRESMLAHLDYSYGSSLGNLRNSNALVSLRCGELLIDQMQYERSTDGRALEFDGRLAPNHELNDDAKHWCAAPEGIDEFLPGNLGTPGAVNNPCGAMPDQDVCLEEDSLRAIVPPEPGQVRISEWMANPAGPDDQFEWVEASFDAAVDLNSFQLGPAPDALKAVVHREECFRVDAGARVVFGASPAAAPRVDAELGFSLGNSGARSIVAGVDGVVLDRVDYEDATEGVAWQVDADGRVCLTPSEQEYQPGNLGTPAEINATCPAILEPGTCFDDGLPRELVSPSPGQAWISEWMANPGAVGNRDGEWVEVRFDTGVDLNGLALSDLTGSATTVDQEDCLSVNAGTHVLFARKTDPLANGGIESVDLELSLSLNNSDEEISLSIDGHVIDSIAYRRSAVGVATQVDELGRVCDAAEPYGDGDLGTPGHANPWCA